MESIYDNDLWEEFKELNKNDHDTPNYVMEYRYQEYYEENKHRLKKNGKLRKINSL